MLLTSALRVCRQLLQHKMVQKDIAKKKKELLTYDNLKKKKPILSSFETWHLVNNKTK